jgi:signal transduction histidine kinase
MRPPTEPNIIDHLFGMPFLTVRWYGVLIVGGAILAGYLAVVAITAPVLDARNDNLSPLLATALVAVVFHPLRIVIQRAANRLLYGDRDDPYGVLHRLNRRLEQEQLTSALPQVLETVTDALHVPFAAIELIDDGHRRRVASLGRDAIAPESFPMTYQQEVVGSLLVSPRSAGSRLTAAERRLLRDLAAQAGVATHAVQLTAELRRSRERLVRSREQERRRLRRELHDGLGPALAGMTLQVSAAKVLIRQDQVLAEATLEGLERQLQASLVEVRSVVDDLRPAVLDQLGLVKSLEAAVARFSPPAGTGPVISVTVVGASDLPAAVEVAAYRIAVEALTNVIKHARASRCDLLLALTDTLTLHITDDGVGMPEKPGPGVGLQSMRERVEELGGTFAVTHLRSGGTRVHAEIPLAAP